MNKTLSNQTKLKKIQKILIKIVEKKNYQIKQHKI